MIGHRHRLLLRQTRLEKIVFGGMPAAARHSTDQAPDCSRDAKQLLAPDLTE